MRHVKVVLMGSGAVGKTSLTTQFVREIFEDRYEPTIEEVHKKTIEIDGEMCSMELLDTAGVEQFAQMRDVHIAEGHGFVLVYSVVDRSTFEDAQIIREEISKIKGESFPLLLVGNKRDLSDCREVDTKDGEDLSSQWRHCAFMESSAKCKDDAEKMFSSAARQIIKFEQTIKPRKASTKRSFRKNRERNCQCVIL